MVIGLAYWLKLGRLCTLEVNVLGYYLVNQLEKEEVELADCSEVQIHQRIHVMSELLLLSLLW